MPKVIDAEHAQHIRAWIERQSQLAENLLATMTKELELLQYECAHWNMDVRKGYSSKHCHCPDCGVTATFGYVCK